MLMDDCTHEQCDQVDGFRVCCTCGLVVSNVPQDVEWQLGANEHGERDVRQRASTTSSIWESCGSIVGDKSLQRYQQGLSGANKERVFTAGCEFISDVCTDLLLGKHVEFEATSIFSHVREQHSRWRGARRLGILIACVSIACQRLSVGISDAKILNLERVQQPSKTMNAQKKQVLIILHQKGVVVHQANASNYCLRVCSDLGFNKHVSRMVGAQAEKISKKEHLNARSCSMIVAVSVLSLIEKYNLCINIQQLCTMVNVTRPTLFKWYADASKRDISITRKLIQSFDSSKIK